MSDIYRIKVFTIKSKLVPFSVVATSQPHVATKHLKRDFPN